MRNLFRFVAFLTVALATPINSVMAQEAVINIPYEIVAFGITPPDPEVGEPVQINVVFGEADTIWFRNLGGDGRVTASVDAQTGRSFFNFSTVGNWLVFATSNDQLVASTVITVAPTGYRDDVKVKKIRFDVSSIKSLSVTTPVVRPGEKIEFEIVGCGFFRLMEILQDETNLFLDMYLHPESDNDNWQQRVSELEFEFVPTGPHVANVRLTDGAKSGNYRLTIIIPGHPKKPIWRSKNIVTVLPAEPEPASEEPAHEPTSTPEPMATVQIFGAIDVEPIDVVKANKHFVVELLYDHDVMNVTMNVSNSVTFEKEEEARLWIGWMLGSFEHLGFEVTRRQFSPALGVDGVGQKYTYVSLKPTDYRRLCPDEGVTTTQQRVPPWLP